MTENDGTTQLNAAQAVEYLTHVDWRGSRLGLGRMKELLARLGEPQLRLRFVHVAGTNGKGSVCAMLAAVLRQAGVRTGLYTSPFISRFNERIQLDGVPISDAQLAEVTARVRAAAEPMDDHPTEFELVTAVALQFYAEQACQVVVLEVGLGGRLDATNVIPPPDVAVLTPISYDHTAILGDTLEKIAAEKAGIIKAGSRVVCAPQPPGAYEVIRRACRERGAALTTVDAALVRRTANSLDGQRFVYNGFETLSIGLLGGYQCENATVVVEVAGQLEHAGVPVPWQAVSAGLAGARWPARFEVLHRAPWFVVDGGHNPQGAGAVAENLKAYFPGRRVVFVLGVMADKDYPAMFEQILPMAEQVFTVPVATPRALPAGELAAWFKGQGVQARSCPSVAAGVQAALAAAGDDGVACAFGTFYMAGPVRQYFGL